MKKNNKNKIPLPDKAQVKLEKIIKKSNAENRALRKILRGLEGIGPVPGEEKDNP